MGELHCNRTAQYRDRTAQHRDRTAQHRDRTATANCTATAGLTPPQPIALLSRRSLRSLLPALLIPRADGRSARERRAARAGSNGFVECISGGSTERVRSKSTASLPRHL
jgi:hypothetical protein